LRLEDSGQFGRINLEAPVILPLRRKPACPDGAPDIPLAARSDSWRTKLRNTKPAEWPDSQVDGWRLLSLIRASAMVKRQSAPGVGGVAAFCQALTWSTIVCLSGNASVETLGGEHAEF
jgi:hypothetical protein